MSSSRPVCRFFNTDAGCRFGIRCSFQHVTGGGGTASSSSSCSSPSHEPHHHNSVQQTPQINVFAGADEYGMCRDEGVLVNYTFDTSMQDLDEDEYAVHDGEGDGSAAVITTPVFTPYDCR
jgi:hypothetical protein